MSCFFSAKSGVASALFAFACAVSYPASAARADGPQPSDAEWQAVRAGSSTRAALENDYPIYMRDFNNDYGLLANGKMDPKAFKQKYSAFSAAFSEEIDGTIMAAPQTSPKKAGTKGKNPKLSYSEELEQDKAKWRAPDISQGCVKLGGTPTCPGLPSTGANCLDSRIRVPQVARITSVNDDYLKWAKASNAAIGDQSYKKRPENVDVYSVYIPPGTIPHTAVGSSLQVYFDRDTHSVFKIDNANVNSSDGMTLWDPRKEYPDLGPGNTQAILGEKLLPENPFTPNIPGATPLQNVHARQGASFDMLVNPFLKAIESCDFAQDQLHAAAVYADPISSVENSFFGKCDEGMPCCSTSTGQVLCHQDIALGKGDLVSSMQDVSDKLTDEDKKDQQLSEHEAATLLNLELLHESRLSYMNKQAEILESMDGAAWADQFPLGTYQPTDAWSPPTQGPTYKRSPETMMGGGSVSSPCNLGRNGKRLGRDFYGDYGEKLNARIKSLSDRAAYPELKQAAAQYNKKLISDILQIEWRECRADVAKHTSWATDYRKELEQDEGRSFLAYRMGRDARKKIIDSLKADLLVTGDPALSWEFSKKSDARVGQSSHLKQGCFSDDSQLSLHQLQRYVQNLSPESATWKTISQDGYTAQAVNAGKLSVLNALGSNLADAIDQCKKAKEDWGPRHFKFISGDDKGLDLYKQRELMQRVLQKYATGNPPKLKALAMFKKVKCGWEATQSDYDEETGTINKIEGAAVFAGTVATAGLGGEAAPLLLGMLTAGDLAFTAGMISDSIQDTSRERERLRAMYDGGFASVEALHAAESAYETTLWMSAGTAVIAAGATVAGPAIGKLRGALITRELIGKSVEGTEFGLVRDAIRINGGKIAEPVAKEAIELCMRNECLKGAALVSGWASKVNAAESAARAAAKTAISADAELGAARDALGAVERRSGTAAEKSTAEDAVAAAEKKLRQAEADLHALNLGVDAARSGNKFARASTLPQFETAVAQEGAPSKGSVRVRVDVDGDVRMMEGVLTRTGRNGESAGPGSIFLRDSRGNFQKISDRSVIVDALKEGEAVKVKLPGGEEVSGLLREFNPAGERGPGGRPWVEDAAGNFHPAPVDAKAYARIPGAKIPKPKTSALAPGVIQEVLEQSGERKLAPDGYVWFVPKSGNPMLVGKDFSASAKSAISQISAARDFAALSGEELSERASATVTHLDDAGRRVTTAGKPMGYGVPAPGEDYAGVLCALVDTGGGNIRAIPRDRILGVISKKTGMSGIGQAVVQSVRRTVDAVKSEKPPLPQGAAASGVNVLLDQVFSGVDRAVASRAVAAFSEEDLSALEKYAAAITEREKHLAESADPVAGRQAIDKSRKETEEYLKNWVRCRGL